MSDQQVAGAHEGARHDARCDPLRGELLDPDDDPCIVIIDDEPANVALLGEVLHRAGYHHVVSTTEPGEGLRLCRQHGADLVLVDLHMPHMDGLEIVSRLRVDRPVDEYLPVMVITADVSAGVRHRALSAGVSDFLTKPFDVTEVQLRVSNHLRTRQLHQLVRRQRSALEQEVEDLEVAAASGRVELARRRHEVERLLEPGGLVMVYQPIVDPTSDRVAGCEALARFPAHPHDRPDRWFHQAAEVGLGVELELALRLAGRALAHLPEDVYLSVNTSPEGAMAAGIGDALRSIDPARVVIELTEHTEVDDYECLVEHCNELRADGLRIAVDDAGAGFASMRHILRLRPDIIKLDRSLVAGIDRDPAGRALAAALTAFATEIDAVVVAEGIERGAELDVVLALGIRHVQGLYTGAPQPLEALLASPALGGTAPILHLN